MSNILPTDTRPESKVVFCKKLSSYAIKGNQITLSCGVRFSPVVRMLQSDMKMFYPSLVGIPGTVGGMVCQNASCFDDEIASAFLQCRLLSLTDKRIIQLNREEMRFSYRSSILKDKRFILLDATFSLHDGDARSIMSRAIEKRKTVMPEGPSLGSVFLRENGISIGYLLDKLGQKGRKFGGIAISEKHAGILINQNKGTATDFKNAVSVLSDLIYQNYGFIPKLEVEYLK
jgi:UDP-N-acetylmuramate dehydrogenase